ncbi:hypothetical protein Q5752_005703 [Cryptotrichosporon argae]
MPQPPLDIPKYLASPLPPLREAYPPGTGGTGPRASWPEGTLKGVQVLDDFAAQAKAYMCTVSSEPVPPHQGFKYPKTAQAITHLPNPIKSPADLQKCLSTLPLAAIAAVLTAVDADPSDVQTVLDQAGYESDGGEEMHVLPEGGKTRGWYWKFNKSPLGSGEFLLSRQGEDKVYLVVRTINSSAFTQHDWDEYVVTGPYHYATTSKASWYWSRTWGAARRLDAQYWVLTDWQRWTFGKFDEKREHGWTSPILPYDATDPSVCEALYYWAQASIGRADVKLDKKNTAGLPALFPPNPARRVSKSGGRRDKGLRDMRKVRAANESDIEDSDAE